MSHNELYVLANIAVAIIRVNISNGPLVSICRPFQVCTCTDESFRIFNLTASAVLAIMLNTSQKEMWLRPKVTTTHQASTTKA
jgi:hypothetical protein